MSRFYKIVPSVWMISRKMNADFDLCKNIDNFESALDDENATICKIPSGLTAAPVAYSGK